jgi:2-C-methyl-D-erythritol 4-phosphate cytidylyltransferase
MRGMKTVAVILCAAGASKRFGGNRKKPFVNVDGRAAFLRSVDLFADRSDVKQILLAISPEDDEIVKVMWGAHLSFGGVKICHGGAERCQTIAKAMELVKPEIDLIAVHDAARCCVTADWLEAVIEMAGKTGAAMLACPVVATLKRVANGQIVETIDRSDLYEAQTPQIFDANLLRRAYKNLAQYPPAKVSDDSFLVEALGQKVAIVATDHSNIKITTQNDIPIAEAILHSRPKPKPEGPIGPYVEAQW